MNRVYRLSWLMRSFSLFFMMFGLAISFQAASSGLDSIEGTTTAVLLGVFLFPVIGIGMTVNAFLSTVSFKENKIELRSIFSEKKMPLSSIRGRREFVVEGGGGEDGGSTRYLKLESNDRLCPEMSFMKQYNFDEEFYKWFYELPDLDEEGKKNKKTSNFGLV